MLLLRELSREVDAMDVLFRWSTEKDLVLINSGAQNLSLAPKHCRASAGETAQIEARPAAAPEPRFLGI